MLITIIVILVGYLLGSIPTALIVSRVVKGVDIRTLGDGNMGARNTARSLGTRYGVIVALSDVGKGALAVLFAKAMDTSLDVQMITGVAAILGHDFPIFAGFKGGQGLATSDGTFLILFPVPTMIGLTTQGLIYLITRHSDLAAGINGGLVAVILLVQRNWEGLIYLVIMLLNIPFKQWLDRSRRKEIEAAENKKSQV